MDFSFLKQAAPVGPKPDRSALKKNDLELWQKWKDSGHHPDHLRPLLTSFKGMIHSHVNKYAKNVEVPPAAIKHEFTEQFVHALKTYDPSKGTALASWVTTNLQKGQRWINSQQNFGRIADPRAGKIGDFNNIKAQLDQEFGREPTTMELAEAMGWSEAEVTRMQAELRKSHVASSWEIDPIKIAPSKEKEAMLMVRYDLTPEELLVYEYTIGYGGKPILKPIEIAKKLNTNPSKITRIRQKIAKMIQEYI